MLTNDGSAASWGVDVLVQVYGDPTVHPQPESYWGNVNPIGPRACYDEGKRVAETMMYAYKSQGTLIHTKRLCLFEPSDGKEWVCVCVNPNVFHSFSQWVVSPGFDLTGCVPCVGMAGQVEVRVARIFNTFGPRMHPNDGRVVSNFIIQVPTASDYRARRWMLTIYRWLCSF
jgi:UDP-glucuronate decarboxylase